MINTLYKDIESLYIKMNEALVDTRSSYDICFNSKKYELIMPFSKEEAQKLEQDRHELIVELLYHQVRAIVDNICDKNDPRRNKCDCVYAQDEEIDVDYCNDCERYLSVNSPGCYSCHGPEYRSSWNEIVYKLVNHISDYKAKPGDKIVKRYKNGEPIPKESYEKFQWSKEVIDSAQDKEWIRWVKKDEM